MATTTTNLGLTKPAYGESADIAVINANMDIIDEAVSALLLRAYPVGSIYTSTSSTNPASLFGGTWVAFGAGRVLMGAGNSSYPAGSTGGEYTHTLTTDEMPSHSHTVYGGPLWDSSDTYATSRGGGTANRNRETSSVGGGQAHNNMQPYIVVYMWKRTA